MLITRCALALSALLGLLIGAMTALALTGGRLSPFGDFLAYDRILSRRSDLFLYDPARQISLNLTRTRDYSESSAAWSNDGRLAYIVDEFGQVSLYVQDLENGRRIRAALTFAPMADPAWSPDGRLAYVSGEDGNMEVYLYDFEVGDTVNITRYPLDDFDPTWMPDGRLSFVSGRTGNLDVFALDVDSREVENLTLDAAPDIQMRWSTNGLGAFVRAHTVERQSAFNPTPITDTEVYALNLTDGAQTDVSQWLGFDSDPVWSDDGRLAFVSQRSGSMDILVLNLATGELVNATQHPAQDTDPQWSPTGKLAFQSLRQPAGIYMMNAPGASAYLVAADASHAVWWHWP